MKIYAMSDIHGCLEPFKEALSTIDLDDPDSKLVLLGDYCDRGPDSLGVFELIMQLEERYGERIMALRGNHEEMLLEYVDGVGGADSARTWMLTDSNLSTAASFLTPEEFGQVRDLLLAKRFEDAYRLAVERIVEGHGDVVEWIRSLPYYYESEFGQVFVHAGIDEEAGDLWKACTPPEWFTAMSPEYAGRHFELDVIAGHINTETVSGIPGYRGIWHDGASHYYVDGNVVRYGEVPLLTFDSKTGKYSGPGLS